MKKFMEKLLYLGLQRSSLGDCLEDLAIRANHVTTSIVFVFIEF